MTHRIIIRTMRKCYCVVEYLVQSVYNPNDAKGYVSLSVIVKYFKMLVYNGSD